LLGCIPSSYSQFTNVSFVDRNMLMRHFSQGVGHLKYERQQEVGPEITVEREGDNDSYDIGQTDKDMQESDHDIDVIEEGSPGLEEPKGDDDDVWNSDLESNSSELEVESNGSDKDGLDDDTDLDSVSSGYASY
jgi:hypothetical protein